jgi:hypothetical protein
MAAAGLPSPLQQALRRLGALLAEAGRRRRSYARRAGVTRLTSRVLAKGASVHVLRWEGEDLLVGCTEQTMVVLGRRPVDACPGEGA